MTIERIDRENTGDAPEEIQTLASYDISSEPGNELDAAERAVEVVARQGLSGQIQERVKTAVAETTMNAMEHGNHFKPEVPVTIWIGRNESELVVRVVDRGVRYDPGQSEQPDLDAKLAGVQSPRGWGLFLIQNMVDRMRIIPGNQHNVVELRWTIQENHESDAV